MKDFPEHFQEDVDIMALMVRKQNKMLMENLEAQRKHIDEEVARFESEGLILEKSNSNLISQKELSDELVAKLVNGLNQRMSMKARVRNRQNFPDKISGKFFPFRFRRNQCSSGISDFSCSDFKP